MWNVTPSGCFLPYLGHGKKFKVYFTRADTGQAVLLTQFPLASTSTNITFLDQALASPCGVFSISQTLADGSQETLPSTGAGLPSPGGGDVFGGGSGGVGGCNPDPPPAPTGPKWVNTFHHRDHLGSLRVTTDPAGWMISGHDFYPFGMEVAESGQAAGGLSKMKFTGHERDDLTGLDYMKARYSGWFQASFLIPDPGSDVNPRNPQSWNRYAYVRNNPMNLVDPSGLAGDGVAQGEGGGGRRVHHYMNTWELSKAGGCYPGQTAVNCDTLGATDDRVEASQVPADEANQENGAEDPAEPKAESATADGLKVLITYDNGTVEERSGGTRAWRNNNPGNLRNSDFAKNNGSIGEAGGKSPGTPGFAVFPNRTVGENALNKLLGTKTYQGLSVDNAIARFAPPKENDTGNYQGFIRKSTGLDGATKLGTLKPDQLAKVSAMIQRLEGWKEGTVVYRRPNDE